MTSSAMALYSSQNQLSVAWMNSQDQTPCIYVSDQFGSNAATLSLLNGLTSPIAFPSGPSSSSIVVDFNGLLAQEEIRGIKLVSPETWTLTSSLGPSGREVLTLTPIVPSNLNPNDTLAFELNTIECNDQLGAMWVTVQILGVTPPPDLSTSGYNVLVQVANAPRSTDAPLNLNIGFLSGDMVLTSTASQSNTNELNLFLSNPNTLSIEALGTGTDAAFFQLSFLFDPTAQDALTNIIDGNSIRVLNGPGTSWVIDTVNTGAFPVWLLVPPGPPATVLGPNSQATSTVSFTVDDIVTALPAGVTLAYLSYWNLAGYNDGQLAVAITKVDPLSVSPLTLNGIVNPVPPGGLPATGSLEFTVDNATFITITNTGYTNTNPGPSCTDSCPITVSTPTTYTLLALNSKTGQQQATSLTVNSTDSNFQMPIGSIVMWSGPESSVPEGWAICDGRTLNNLQTPDLVGNFIQGADSTLEGTQTAGAVNTSGPPDTHTHLLNASLSGTTSMNGSHNHSISLPACSTTLGGSDKIWALATNFKGAANGGVFTTADNGDHVHSITVNVVDVPTGPQSSPSMRPAWYALYFIMKCA